MCLVNSVFMASGIFLNSVVLISIWRSTQLRKKLCYYMIFLLSCFDLAVVCIVHPVEITAIVEFTIRGYNRQRFQQNTLIIMIVQGCSLNALLALNIERFLGVVFPIVHHTSVSKKGVSYGLTLSLVFPISLAIISSRDTIISDNVAVSSFTLLVLFVFFVVNYKMLQVARSSKRNVKRVSPAGSQEKKTFLNFKTASTSSLSMLCMLLCSSFLIIFASLCVAWDISLLDEKVLLYTHWSATMMAMNSTFNCIILFWRNSVLYREGIMTLQRLHLFSFDKLG